MRKTRDKQQQNRLYLFASTTRPCLFVSFEGPDWTMSPHGPTNDAFGNAISVWTIYLNRITKATHGIFWKSRGEWYLRFQAWATMLKTKNTHAILSQILPFTNNHLCILLSLSYLCAERRAYLVWNEFQIISFILVF